MIELLNQVKEIGIIMIPALIRSVAGWAIISLEDSKISKFEIKQLLATVLRVGTIGAAIYYGFPGLNLETSAIASGALAYFADKLFHSMKDTKLFHNIVTAKEESEDAKLAFKAQLDNIIKKYDSEIKENAEKIQNRDKEGHNL